MSDVPQSPRSAKSGHPLAFARLASAVAFERRSGGGYKTHLPLAPSSRRPSHGDRIRRSAISVRRLRRRGGRMIERRAIIAGLLSAVGVPDITRAQSPHAVHKIGYLQITDVRSTTGAADQGAAAILAPVWQKLGYVEGETILARSAQGDLTRIPALLAEL